MAKLHNNSNGGLKPLLTLNGLPIIEHVIDRGVSSGLKNIYLVTGHNSEVLSKAILRSIRKKYGNSEFSIKIVKPPDDWRLGQIHSLLAMESILKNENFILMMSDHLADKEIVSGLTTQDPKDGIILAVDRKIHDNPFVDWDDVTKVNIDAHGQINNIGKQLAEFETTAFDTGFFHCSPKLFDAIRTAIANDKHSLSQAVMYLAQHGNAKTMDIGHACWVDVDTPEMINVARKLFLGSQRNQFIAASKEQNVHDRIRAVGNLRNIVVHSGGLIAHRGGHRDTTTDGCRFGDFVENTHPSYRYADEVAQKNNLVSCIETDVLLSKEGYEAITNINTSGELPSGWRDMAFIMHCDPKPVPGMSKSQQPLFWTGMLSDTDKFTYEMSAQEIENLKLGVPDKNGKIQYRDKESAPNPIRFSDFLEEYIIKRGMYAEIELQPSAFKSYYEKDNYIPPDTASFSEGILLGKIMRHVLGEHRSRVTILCSVPDILYGVHQIMPDVPLEYLIRAKNNKNIADGQFPEIDNLSAMRDNGIVAIHTVSTTGVTGEWISKMNSEGFHVIVGQCNDTPSVTHCLERGAVAVGTDNYENLLDVASRFDARNTMAKTELNARMKLVRYAQNKSLGRA